MPNIESHRAAQGSGIKVQTGAREMRGHRSEKRTSRRAEKQSSGPRKKGGVQVHEIGVKGKSETGHQRHEKKNFTNNS